MRGERVPGTSQALQLCLPDHAWPPTAPDGEQEGQSPAVLLDPRAALEVAYE